MDKYLSKGLAFLSVLFLMFLSLLIPVVPSHASACEEQPVLIFEPVTVPDKGGLVKIKGSGFCMSDNDYGIMISVGLKDTNQFNNSGGYNGPFTVNRMIPKGEILEGVFEISLDIPAYSPAKARVLRSALWSSANSDFSQERPADERYALNLDIPYESVTRVNGNDNEDGTGNKNPTPATCNLSPKLEIEPDPISYEGGIITIKGSGFCEPEKFGAKQGVLVTVGRNDLDEYATVTSTEIGRNFIRLSTEEEEDDYTPDRGGTAVLAADGSFTVKLQVPAQNGDEKYAVFTSGGGFYAGSRDPLDQKLTINFTEKPAVIVEQPSLEVSKAQRAGGKVHVIGKNYLAKYPGIYICVLPDTFDNLHSNADNCYEEKVIWITPNEETNIDANIVHLNEDGSFELDLKVPAFTAGKGWIVSTARAHGLAREDKSQSINVPVVYEAATETPENPDSGKDSKDDNQPFQPSKTKITSLHNDDVNSKVAKVSTESRTQDKKTQNVDSKINSKINKLADTGIEVFIFTLALAMVALGVEIRAFAQREN